MSARDLADIIDGLHREKQTGVLSVSVKSDNNQLKFFFREGKVYFVTYSTCRNLECLIRLGSLVAERGFFLPGAHVDASQPIPLTTADIIDRVRGLKKTIDWSSPAGSAGTGGHAASGTATVTGDRIANIEEELLSMLGPVGTIIFEQAIQTCSITRGASVPKRTYQDLVQAIAREIPEDQRKEFLSMHAF